MSDRTRRGAPGGPLWLDVTRLLSRAGRGAISGIDRVELAWLDHLAGAEGARFLCRTTRGYLLIDGAGARHLAALARGQAVPGRADAWSRLALRGARMRHRVEADLRRHAVDRAAPWALGRMAARHGGAALTYLNTGHANLARATLGGLSAAGVRVAVLIHDLIPVLTPDLVPADQPPAFAAKIETVRQHADLIIANSPDTETELARHWAGAERRPPVLLAPIGVSLPPPPAAPPAREAGRCVMLGTLEPRKNHAVILAAWSRLAADLPPEAMPQLHILGAPGFRGDTVRAAIRAHPLFGRAIHLHGPQGDAVIGDHLARADLLLYPSLAEGFGLPPWEALAAGVLPICADLPVLRDLLGTRAVHLPPEDAYSWAETIKQRLAGTLPGPETPLAGVPLWQDHFERVAAALGPRATRAEGHE